MPRLRFTIGGLMIAIGLLAIGITGVLRPATWTGVMALLAWGVLVFALAGAVLGRPKDRAWWAGFALFGWAYLAIAFWIWPTFDLPMPLIALSVRLQNAFPNNDNVNTISVFGVADEYDLRMAYGPVLHHAFALFVGFLGALVCRACFGEAFPRSEGQPAAPPLAGRAGRPRRCWLWIAVSAAIAAPWITATIAAAARGRLDQGAAAPARSRQGRTSSAAQAASSPESGGAGTGPA